MTKVYLERDGNCFLVSCQGHATGSPEMCAAISCLVGMLEGWLENSGYHVLECRVEPGDVCIRFQGGMICKTAFDVICTGFLRLEATDNVHISVDFVEI